MSRFARFLPLFLVLALIVSVSAPTGPATAAAPDYPVPNGYFYSQAAGREDRGFTVTDDATARFWTEFQRLGGVPGLGYPISRRFSWHGFTVQAFQKVVLQWRPEVGQANAVNLLDLLHEAGQDAWLQRERQVPPPRTWNDAGRPWPEVVAQRQAALRPYPAIEAKYRAAPGDPLILYGLPTSDVVDAGNVFVLRTQRAVFQQWKIAVPWAAAGEVTVANGGDLAKEAGLLPAGPLEPIPAPAPAGGPIPTLEPAGTPRTTPPPLPTLPVVTPTPAGSPARTPTPTAAEPTPTPVETPIGRALSGIERIEERISEIRGLPFRQPVDKRLITGEEIAARFARDFDRPQVQEALRYESLFWRLLGLLPENVNLGESYVDLLGSEVIGFYVPREKRLYVRSDNLEATRFTPIVEITIAHELVHALQDQHFNLGHYLGDPAIESSDEAAARRAVVEGDAVIAQTLYMRQYFTEAQLQELSRGGESAGADLVRTPLILQEQLYFPYSHGAGFIANLYRSGGWNAVNAAFRQPPEGSSQILHPDRYRSGAPLSRRELPEFLADLEPTWDEVFRDTVGELVVRTMVRQFLGLPTGERAAEGWAGDRFVLLAESPDHGAIVGQIAFDDAREAAQFADSYFRAMSVRFQASARLTRAGNQVLYEAEGASVLIEQQDDTVTLVFASSGDLARQLAEIAISGEPSDESRKQTAPRRPRIPLPPRPAPIP